jgi:N-acetylmuramoyl-L-alanine amidase
LNHANNPDAVAAAKEAAPAQEAVAAEMKEGVKAFIMHHTGGRGSVAGVENTLNQRHLGVEYIMDREGNIVPFQGRGAKQMMKGWGPVGTGLNNANTVGMEVIAKDDHDVTAAQVKAAAAFMAKNYPNTPVYGHGEVNPGHKQADEGMKIVNAIRNERSGVGNVAARAAGGPVSRGKPYVVGEHGPELFVPQLSGEISKLPKAVQDAIGPYQGVMKGMPKGDYLFGMGARPWKIPSDRLDIKPDETAEQLKFEWLKARKMIGAPWTQKKLEDMESQRFMKHFWKPGPGTNPPPKIDNINFRDRLKGISLQTAGQTVKGSASLKIALENFPKGTRTTTKLAGMFKDINVDRGHAAPWAAG